MRLFNREVLRTTVFTSEQFTAAELNGLLGSADALAIQWVATRGGSNGTAKVIVNIYQSNDNQNWSLYSSLSSGTLVGNSLETGFLSENMTGTLARGAFVRLGIQLSAADADLVVTVTGRAI
ncbi:MAG: hypothetical protein U0269_30855 [Polyangiales bacterium]